MRWKMLLSRTLTVLTLVVAGLILAPSGAQAHAGHAHEIGTQVLLRAQAVKASFHKEAADQERTVKLVPISGRRAASDTLISVRAASDLEKAQTCLVGCCGSAGAGCCAASVPESIEIFVPCLGRSRLDFSVLAEAGIKLGALPEPPKSLVQ